MKTINEGGRLSLTECKKVLNKNGNHYTDSEILAIRDWLYFLGEMMANDLEKNNEQKTNENKAA